MIDRSLLAKMLARTASSSDAESLTALRKANALIMKEGTTWGEILGVERVLVRPRPIPQRPTPVRANPWESDAANFLREVMDEMAYNMGRGLRGDRRRRR